jgi:hypothetical protein
MGFPFAPNPGGIDETKALTIAVDDFIDGIPRSAGDWRNDSAIDAGQAIQ